MKDSIEEINIVRWKPGRRNWTLTENINPQTWNGTNPFLAENSCCLWVEKNYGYAESQWEKRPWTVVATMGGLMEILLEIIFCLEYDQYGRNIEFVNGLECI